MSPSTMIYNPLSFQGEVGRGVPPLGAPASRRPRAKRERGCGPSARQAGGTPALPGSSRMSGIGKIPVQAAEPLGQPPSRPPPFQGQGVKTQGDRIWKYCGGSAASPSSGGGARSRRLLSSPLQGGGREGGPAAGCAGVPPASREARTRMRAFGPPRRRGAGAPRRFTDERDREGPRPGRRASGSTPSRPPPRAIALEIPSALLPPGRGAGGDNPAARLTPRAAGAGPPSRPPPFQGGGEKTQGEERRPRGPPPCSAIESVPQRGPLAPPPFQGQGVKT